MVNQILFKASRLRTGGWLAGAVFIVQFGLFYPMFVVGPVPFIFLGVGAVPFALGLLGVRARIALPPALLALAIAAGIFMFVAMSGHDPRWWPMMLVLQGPIVFMLGILAAALYFLGGEARRGVMWARQQRQRQR